MLLKLTLGQDNGSEISSLVLPVSQKDYLTLTAQELTEQYVTPYLESLQTDEIVWGRICRMAQGNIAKNFRPA
jgi:hypothetical protein